MSGVWASTELAVSDTQKTAAALQELVARLEPLDGTLNAWKKGIKQLKLDLIYDDIGEIRSRCQTHFASLQISVHTATLSVTTMRLVGDIC